MTRRAQEEANAKGKQALKGCLPGLLFAAFVLAAAVVISLVFG